MAGNRWIAISTGKERAIRVGCGSTPRNLHLTVERCFFLIKPLNIEKKGNNIKTVNSKD